MRPRYLIALLFFLVNFAHAQESIDLFMLSVRYGVPRPYKSDYAGKASELAVLLNLKVPIPLNKSKTTIFYSDLLYSAVFVNNTAPLPNGSADPIKLHGFIFQTGLVKKFDNGTALQLLFVPRFMTDFEDVNAKNWQLGGIGLFEKRYSSKLLMRFGVLYNQELFGTIITPLVYLDWRIADKWSIVGLLPIYAKINYLYSDNLVFGLSHFGFTTTYRLGAPAYQNDYIERSSIDLSLFVRQRISGNIHIEGRLGHTLTRVYAQFEEDQKMDLQLIIFNFGDNRVQKNVNFKDGIIGNIRLIYNFPLTG